MATGEILVAGTDLYTTYGARIIQGGYNGLIQWPVPKTVHTTNWQESDGVDADLSTMYLSSRTFTISLGLKGSTTQVRNLYTFLTAVPQRTWNFAHIGITRDLRVMGVSSLDSAITLHTMAVSVCDDSPASLLSSQSPVTGCVPGDTTCKLDNVNFSDYGVRLLWGTGQSFNTPSAVKELLKIQNSASHGLTYDTSATANTYGQRDITLQCVACAPNYTTLWRNYYALFSAVVKVDENASDATRRAARSLTIGTESIQCYYKSQSVSGLYPIGGNFWITFTLTLSTVGTTTDITNE